MRLIKEKTYRRYLRRIEYLIGFNPKVGTRKGKEILRLAESVSKYEAVHFPITHSDRKLRADILEQLKKKEKQ